MRERVHQRRGLPHPDAAHRTRPGSGEGRPAVVDAQLRHGGDADRVGLHRRPGRRADRAGTGFGADGGCGVRGGVGALARRGRCLSVARRHGGGQQQLGQRPTGGRMVSAGAARPGDGHSADRAAAGSRIGCLGDSAARGKPRRLGGPPVPRSGVRGVRGCVRRRGGRPAAAAASRGRRSRSGQPVPRIVGAVAHPRRVGPAGGSPGRGVDVHAGVADERPRLVRGVGRRDGDGRPDTGRRWTNRCGTLVRHGRFATATDPHHRAGGSGGDGSAGSD